MRAKLLEYRKVKKKSVQRLFAGVLLNILRDGRMKKC